MLGSRIDTTFREQWKKKKEKTWVFLMRFALGNVSGDTWKSECRLKT